MSDQPNKELEAEKIEILTVCSEISEEKRALIIEAIERLRKSEPEEPF